MAKPIRMLISVIITLCTILCMVPFAFADNYEMKIENSHGDNDIYSYPDAPQWSDVLSPKVICDGNTQACYDVRWYRLITEKRDPEDSTKIIREQKDELVGTEGTYRVAAEDIGFALRCDVSCNGKEFSKTTKPVEKKNYGRPILTVQNNSYYGATDGKIYYLDQRMQYSHDQSNVFPVLSETASLPSGENYNNLSPNGYRWYIRFVSTDTVTGGEWFAFDIMPGEKLPISTMRLSYEEFTLTSGKKSVDMEVVTEPIHAYIATKEWTSSDPSVVTVRDGYIEAVDNGTATVSCTVTDNTGKEYTASCKITVEDLNAVKYVAIAENKAILSLQSDELSKGTLKAIISPDDVERTVKVSSSAPQVVKAAFNSETEQINLEAVDEGEADITLSVFQLDGNVIEKTATVTVINPSVTNDPVWVLGSTEGLKFEFKDFVLSNVSVYVKLHSASEYGTDPIDPDNYTISSNKKILTLAPAYLTNLYLTKQTVNDFYDIKIVDNSGTSNPLSSVFDISTIYIKPTEEDARHLKPSSPTVDLTVEGVETDNPIIEWEIDEGDACISVNKETGKVTALSNTPDGNPAIVRCNVYYNVGTKQSPVKGHLYATATTEITVTGYDPLTNAYIVEDSVKITGAARTVQLTKVILPETCEYYTEAWTSSDPEVATVDENGNVKALKDGVCEIVLTVTQGNIVFTDSCNITVDLYKLESYNPTNRTIEARSKTSVMVYTISGVPDDFVPGDSTFNVLVRKSTQASSRKLTYGSDYTITKNENGTITVTLLSDYLRRQTTGTFYISFDFGDGKVESDFYIVKAPTYTQKRGSGANTGDSNNNKVWLMLAFLSVGGITILGRKLKKKKS